MIRLILVLALGFLMQAVRTFAPVGTSAGGASLAFGYVLLTSFFMGQLFKSVGLPRITGYLVTGIVVGPSVLGFLNQHMVDSLGIVNGVANALIALTAGCELSVKELRPLARTIGAVTASAILLPAVTLTAALFAMRDHLPFLAGRDVAAALAVCAVVGVTLVAGSPAVAVAVRDDMEAEGPLSRSVLGAVVLGSLVIILALPFLSALAKSMLGEHADVLSTLGSLAWAVLGAIAAGVLMGAVLALYIDRVRGSSALFLLAASFVAAEVGRRIHLDPLVLSLAAGVFVRNATAAGDRLQADVEASALPVYVVFFAVAGATLHLSILAQLGLPALALVLVRGASILLGARIGAVAASAPPVVRAGVGLGLLPQAGLALALAMLFREAFPEFGADASALVLGVVALNEMVAPALYRLALVRSGEAGARARQAPISHSERQVG